ncbi:hypothetical protein C8Q69DRAFT_509030 [Paecilomyces variotii]|uniref:Uncharacterized protein n=1 Tax=Byssochlamys spectabilis TaxID=264951 RepID=A0A443HPP8_BYSSP|nr:hypothetical protein C8Q69DRAFT_509030 [Paecilomyces variotii]RWQ93808.1 hypothetical protein C8Q69DRAFT_509030 [Paecilomyces variotii]
MECSKSPAEQVIAAFRERDIPFRKEIIESAFANEPDGPANSTWVSNHLRSDTLLSKEEINLYAKIESSGALQGLLSTADLTATRPLLEDDIRTAISSLKESTASIKRRTEVLTAQCELAKKRLRDDNEYHKNRGKALTDVQRRHQLERQHISAAADDLAQTLEARMRTGTESTVIESRKLFSLVTARLKDDDRTLQKLEGLLSRLGSDDEDRAAGKRATELTSRLSGYVSEEIQCRLDRLYMETINSTSESSAFNGAGGEDEVLLALQEELESLYPEITVLSDISAKQQFSDPIQRELENHHGNMYSASEKKLSHILDILSEMTMSTQDIRERLRDRQSYRECLEGLIGVYKTEMDVKLSEPTSRRESLLKDTLRSSLGSPRPRDSERRKSTLPILESPSLESVLRRLGTSVDTVLRPSEEGGGLDTLHEKKISMLERLHNLVVAADVPLLSHLNQADQAGQLLHSSLHAESTWSPSLLDAVQEKDLAELERQLVRVQKGVERVNLEDLHQRNKHRDRFMERWS